MFDTDKMMGDIKKRRAKAKAEAEARKKANDLEAKAKHKKEVSKATGIDFTEAFVDDLVIEGSGDDYPTLGPIGDGKIHFNPGGPLAEMPPVEQLNIVGRERLAKAKNTQTIEPVGARGNASDELAVEDNGAIGRDITLSPSIESYQYGQIFKFPPPDPEKTKEVFDALNSKVEPATTNMTARERLERQISDLIDKANRAIKERTNLTRDALDILEMARNTAYTEPMGEVAVTIHEAARRLSDLEPEFSSTANNLGNLATEIQQSEQLRETNK